MVAVDVEKALANFGEAAASEKLETMGERCAEPGCDFWMRPVALAIPLERILRSVWSLLTPGEGIGAEYDALRIAVELRAAGRFCLRAAMLES